MPRDSLRDLFTGLAALRGEALIDGNGFRRTSRTYGELVRASRGLAARLSSAGIQKGDRLMLWSENRPEWIAALWGALISGVSVVPLDDRHSPGFAARVAQTVEARLWLVGAEVDPGAAEAAGAPPATFWRLDDLAWDADGPLPDVPICRDDTAEIIFTSGATAEPKGVVLTHGNLLANIEPIEREIGKYRAYGRPFFPLRFLNVLPLSHMFGQTMAAFIPPLLPGTAVFTRGHNPADLIRTIRAERVSVLVTVPRVLDVLRGYLTQTVPSVADAAGARRHWVRRWWYYRDVHRLLGLKFWCVVVGGAALEEDLEAFWGRLGLIIIQGYGLTETAPVVTLNHPFAARRGSVGKPLAGVEVTLAPDGEILVRGGNVTRGYYGAPDATREAFEDGWLRTGDIGGLDESGHLFVRGRKKEMIVTPDGLNVFPGDIERVLDAIPGVRESAVVGVGEHGREAVCAVVVIDGAADLAGIQSAANARLDAHQRVRDVVPWPAGSLPRTEGTRKLKRTAIRAWVSGARTPAAPAGDADDVGALVARVAHGRPVADTASLETLGLSSLDRIELLVSLEQRLGISLDEDTFAGTQTVNDLRALVRRAASQTGASFVEGPGLPMPAWAGTWPVRAWRRLLLGTLVLPGVRLAARLRVSGLEHLEGLSGPVVFAANHQSHLDTPAILAALPHAWRYHLAPAMAKEYFASHFHPEGVPPGRRLRWSTMYYLAVASFGAFPLPQRESGSRDVMRFMGQLVDGGTSILIFPEGIRTDEGEIRPFKPGVGMVATRLGLPVVPVRLEGLDRILHKSWKWPRPGPARVAFGPAIRFGEERYEDIAARIERMVRDL
jgi:long-chain acyl-CoA synthetase